MYEELDEAILRYLRERQFGVTAWGVHIGTDYRACEVGPEYATHRGYELLQSRLYALRKKGLVSYLPGQGWVAIQKEGA